MQKAEVCMFCYYRNKRIAACAHAGTATNARRDAAAETEAAAPSAVPARPLPPLPPEKRPF